MMKIIYTVPNLWKHKSKVCDMTEMSGAFDKSVFDGYTILLKISEECNRYMYV